MGPHVHTQAFRVVMSEVDASQIHFTAIYRWMDRGLSEWLAEIGRPFTRILAEGPGIPIVDSRCAFLGAHHARRRDRPHDHRGRDRSDLLPQPPPLRPRLRGGRARGAGARVRGPGHAGDGPRARTGCARGRAPTRTCRPPAHSRPTHATDASGGVTPPCRILRSGQRSRRARGARRAAEVRLDHPGTPGGRRAPRPLWAQPPPGAASRRGRVVARPGRDGRRLVHAQPPRAGRVRRGGA